MLQYTCQPFGYEYVLILVSGERIDILPHVITRDFGDLFYYAAFVNPQKGQELANQLPPGRHGTVRLEDIDVYIQPLPDAVMAQLQITIGAHHHEALSISAFEALVMNVLHSL